MWMLQTEYRNGSSDSMQDRNIQLVWNFDQFRPNIWVSADRQTTFSMQAVLFRGLQTMDNGGTVANFAGNGTLATNFGPHQIGIRNIDLPSWSIENTQLGAKYEGVTSGGFRSL